MIIRLCLFNKLNPLKSNDDFEVLLTNHRREDLHGEPAACNETPLN